MNDPLLRLIAGGIVCLGGVCVVGMVVTATFGRDPSIVLVVCVSLAQMCGTIVGGLVGMLVPTGRPPNQLSNVYQPGPATVSFQPPTATVPSQNTGP